MSQSQTIATTGNLEFSSDIVHNGRDATSIPGSVTVFHLEGEQFGVMQEVVELSVSDEGMNGTSVEPVSPGAVVSMGFEQPGYPARKGEVVGCIRCDEGWQIGIQFHANAAA
ncbi:MAG: hypothetical protein MK085_08300 [Phycisphaerales bacterium]|nr:hypothetical protein [Phycisphaerales bacterium]